MEAKKSNVRVDRKKSELVELRGVINEFVRKKGRQENTFISKVGICTTEIVYSSSKALLNAK